MRLYGNFVLLLYLMKIFIYGNERNINIILWVNIFFIKFFFLFRIIVVIINICIFVVVFICCIVLFFIV